MVIPSEGTMEIFGVFIYAQISTGGRAIAEASVIPEKFAYALYLVIVLLGNVERKCEHFIFIVVLYLLLSLENHAMYLYSVFADDGIVGLGMVRFYSVGCGIGRDLPICRSGRE